MKYPKQKVKIRFVYSDKKEYNSPQLLKGILAALWDRREEIKVRESIQETTRLLQENKIFFYPYALDNYKTKILSDTISGFQVFDWESKDEDIHHICEYCRNWEKVTCQEKPIYQKDSIAIFICPKCQAIIVDDVLGFKGSGEIMYLTNKQLQERFGITLTEDNYNTY